MRSPYLHRTALGMALAVLGIACSAFGVTAVGLRCEYKSDPLGIDVRSPRLSWNLQSEQRGEMQTAYRVLVAGSRELLDSDKADLWDSGKIEGDQCIGVTYGGTPLKTATRCYWKVKVWGKDGTESEFSKPAIWEMGLLEQADWKAQWISAPYAEPTAAALPSTEPTSDHAAAAATRPTTKPAKKSPRPKVVHSGPPKYFRNPFTAEKPIKSARLYATALGLYTCSINGARVGDIVLSPDWTDYHKRVLYQTYDVTNMIKPGANVLGALLGDGWYSGHVGLTPGHVYGTHPALKAQLEIEYTDGTHQTVATDNRWKYADGPIVFSDLLDGEDYDARKELIGWDTTDFDDRAWMPAEIFDAQVQLDAQIAPPVREVREVQPVAISEPAPGRYTFDLGQNMVGYVKLKVKGTSGQKLTLHFAEMLKPDKTVYLTNLRGARATDSYILRGGGEETWEPHFTFHGFRYVEVLGLDVKPSLDLITGIVIQSQTPAAGGWECSEPMLNQLYSNISWGQRGNYLSVPTDCPQRDERLGWMGDAQVFVRTASYNADVDAFFNHWLIDVSDAQSAGGAFADVSPRVAAGEGVAGWADAGIICPWTIYLVYGDRAVLDRQYPSMVKYIDYMKSNSKELIRPAKGYGDWLSDRADTPKDVLATAYFAYSTHLVAKSAKVLGKNDDAARYEQLFQDIKRAFNESFVEPDGKMKGDTQTDYLLALKFDLIDEAKKPDAVRRLAENIASRDTHLSTGFIGVSYLLPTLTRYGRTDLAYQLLNQRSYPSWLFSVDHGATTIWERWDGWTPEKGFQTPSMNSFNHYSLGSCGEWMYATAAGIDLDPDRPAYKHIILHPHPGGGLLWVKASYQSVYGRIASSWTLNGGEFQWQFTVPPNTTATVFLPATAVDQEIKPVDGATFVKADGDARVYEVGSGEYAFSSRYAPGPTTR